MSAYANFVKDYPSRCLKLLDLRLEVEKKNLEVTMLLAVAGQSIIMPLERLEIASPEQPHPSADAKIFKRAAHKLSSILNKTCGESDLFSKDLDDWKYKECHSTEEAVKEFVQQTKSVSEKKCLTIFKILRNAMAHGNLRTNGNPISSLIFLSRISDTGKFNRLECSPEALRKLLQNWAEELKDLDLMPDQIIESSHYFSDHEEEVA
jgi:hypothetical protein